MAKEIRFTLSDDDHERLAALKNERGYTWKGLMLEGAKRLDSGEQ
jgi:hypothetical protein